MDLSLEKKVGQVFMLGFSGKEPENAFSLISEMNIGGIIYFAGNVDSVEQTSDLSYAIQEYASDHGSGIPLFISADQEGGHVCRLTQDIPRPPGAMALGSVGVPSLVYDVSKASAVQLRAAGINMDLAPVLDVNDNPDNPVICIRSYGEKPLMVGECGSQAMNGFIRGGVIPVGKHFPGHGNTSVDSHLDLPVLNHSLQRLSKVELAPFRRAIEEGIPCIMPAHIVFKAIDPDKPATLSHKLLNGLLRTELGFDGLILTDDMHMKAVSIDPGVVEGTVQAFKAGCDMILICRSPEIQKEAYLALLNAVKFGDIPESRLDESVERILNLKKEVGIPNPLPHTAACDPDISGLYKEVYRRSITVVKDEAKLIPLSKDTVYRVLSKTDTTLHQKLEDKLVIGAGSKESVAIILIHNARKNPDQFDFAREALKMEPNAILVATGDPFDLESLPQARTMVCTFGSHPEAMEALASLLAGDFKAVGRMPVTLRL